LLLNPTSVRNSEIEDEMLVQSGNSKGKNPIYDESKSQFFLATTAAAAGSLHADASLRVNHGNQHGDN
jgi:hypothetical protein